MTDWNVHIHAYDDLDMLREAVESVPEGVPIHVFDGRYHTFPGERNATPEIRDFCTTHPDCTYHHPDHDDLPFGDPNTLGEWRSAVHEKAMWAFELLPEHEWTLKLDTDERLNAFDTSLFDGLKPSGKYCPRIAMEDDPMGDVHIARLWQPRYWTPWIDDCLLPRDLLPRDVSLERLHTAWEKYQMLRFVDRYEITEIQIHNVGSDRSDDYLSRRTIHLQNIGRDDRAAAVTEMMGDGESEPSA